MKKIPVKINFWVTISGSHFEARPAQHQMMGMDAYSALISVLGGVGNVRFSIFNHKLEKQSKCLWRDMQ